METKFRAHDALKPKGLVSAAEYTTRRTRTLTPAYSIFQPWEADNITISERLVGALNMADHISRLFARQHLASRPPKFINLRPQITHLCRRGIVGFRQDFPGDSRERAGSRQVSGEKVFHGVFLI